MADGGEGTLDALGGPNRVATRHRPAGRSGRGGVAARRHAGRDRDGRASGLALVGGAEGNDPIAATTTGTGELIAMARRERARRGSSSASADRRPPTAASARCERSSRSTAATASSWSWPATCAPPSSTPPTCSRPQKGATRGAGRAARRRLERLAEVYLERPRRRRAASCTGSGAAGGLAGGLAAVGARSSSGFDLVADEVELYDAIEEADLVITGEGFLDAESFDGKVVGGVAELAAQLGVPVLAVAGDCFDGARAAHRRRLAGRPLRRRAGPPTRSPASRRRCSSGSAEPSPRVRRERCGGTRATSTSGGRSVTSTDAAGRGRAARASRSPRRARASARCSASWITAMAWGDELVERTVAVEALAEVDLGDRRRARTRRSMSISSPRSTP